MQFGKNVRSVKYAFCGNSNFILIECKKYLEKFDNIKWLTLLMIFIGNRNSTKGQRTYDSRLIREVMYLLAFEEAAAHNGECN